MPASPWTPAISVPSAPTSCVALSTATSTFSGLDLPPPACLPPPAVASSPPTSPKPLVSTIAATNASDQQGPDVAGVDRQAPIELGKPIAELRAARPSNHTAIAPGGASSTSSGAASSPRASATAASASVASDARSGARPAHSRSRRTSRACWMMRKARIARPRKAAMPR